MKFPHLEPPIWVQRHSRRPNIYLNKQFFFNAKREVRFRWQRMTKGYAFSDTWNLDHTLAQYLCSTITEFRDVTFAYPQSFESLEDWRAMLTEMASGFCYYAEHEYDMPDNYKQHNYELEVRLNRSMKLLKRYFRGLWW